MIFFARLGIIVLNIIYYFHKQFPVKNQITFLSRQSNHASIDYYLLKSQFEESIPEIRIVEIYKMIPKSFAGKIIYLFNMVGIQMHALATSKIVILDGYSVLASVLKHKKSLRIIQMWHAMGSLKSFGYMALDSNEGNTEGIAQVFQMHKQYDYICASSRVCVEPLAKAFGNSVNKFVIMSLPRIDIITDENYSALTKERIIEKYPDINAKQNILYAPTFRKNKQFINEIESLIDSIDFNKYNLILKLHPLVYNSIKSDKAIIIEDFTSIELLTISDFVITDYSAFMFEAAVANIPIVLYVFDYNEYEKNRGFLIDFDKEVPFDKCMTAKEVVEVINSNNFDLTIIAQFADKYISNQKHCTKKFAKFIIDIYNEYDI